MRTPIRKPGKYTLLPTDPNMTEATFRDLQQQLERLKKSQPAAIAETIRMAAHGDFSENAGYQMAKARLRGINARILELEERLKFAVIIRPNKNSATVQLGSLVTVQTSTETKTYRILGSTETDPAAGVISHLSPIGVALMGRRVGDVVTVPHARRTIEYKIIKIE